jgi:ADP-L-glycero-D-manno-heptose 6-epimerase
VIYKMAGKVEKEGSIQLFKSTEPDKYGDGEQVRDFIYVKDAVRMTAGFLDKEAYGIFNIGRGEVVSWNQLANALFQALGKPPKIQYIDMPQQLAKQYQNYTCADMQKYLNVYGKSTPFTSINDAVNEYVNCYLLRNARW